MQNRRKNNDNCYNRLLSAIAADSKRISPSIRSQKENAFNETVSNRQRQSARGRKASFVYNAFVVSRRGCYKLQKSDAKKSNKMNNKQRLRSSLVSLLLLPCTFYAVAVVRGIEIETVEQLDARAKASTLLPSIWLSTFVGDDVDHWRISMANDSKRRRSRGCCN